MNIKLKAALEVAGALVGLVVISVGVRLGLDALSTVYGPEKVIQGITTACVMAAAYFIVGVLYDVRVSQLEYKAKLEEMTKK